MQLLGLRPRQPDEVVGQREGAPRLGGDALQQRLFLGVLRLVQFDQGQDRRLRRAHVVRQEVQRFVALALRLLHRGEVDQLHDPAGATAVARHAFEQHVGGVGAFGAQSAVVGVGDLRQAGQQRAVGAAQPGGEQGPGALAGQDVARLVEEGGGGGVGQHDEAVAVDHAQRGAQAVDGVVHQPVQLAQGVQRLARGGDVALQRVAAAGRALGQHAGLAFQPGHFVGQVVHGAAQALPAPQWVGQRQSGQGGQRRQPHAEAVLRAPGAQQHGGGQPAQQRRGRPAAP